MNTNDIELSDKYNSQLIDFFEANILPELPDNAIKAINIIVSAYLSAMMNITYHIALMSEDNALANRIDMLNRKYATIANSKLTVASDH